MEAPALTALILIAAGLVWLWLETRKDTAMTDDIRKAATNAAAMLGAVYEWIDRIEANGGATSISGIASCNAFLKSMKTNRARTEKLVMGPLRAALEKDARND